MPCQPLRLTLTYDPDGAPSPISVILQKTSVARVSVRVEENRKLAGSRTGVGRLKVVGSAFPRLCRWTVESYVTRAQLLDLQKILEYQETEPLTVLKVKDECERLPDFKASLNATRAIVSSSTITSGNYTESYYTFDVWLNAPDEAWYEPVRDEYRVSLELKERY